MKGKLCFENAWAREGFFGKNMAQNAAITGLQGPGPGHPVSPHRVKAPRAAEMGTSGACSEAEFAAWNPSAGVNFGKLGDHLPWVAQSTGIRVNRRGVPGQAPLTQEVAPSKDAASNSSRILHSEARFRSASHSNRLINNMLLSLSKVSRITAACHANGRPQRRRRVSLAVGFDGAVFFELLKGESLHWEGP
jgi:hypothetical protein